MNMGVWHGGGDSLCISIASGVLLLYLVGFEAGQPRYSARREGGYTTLLCALEVFCDPSLPVHILVAQVLSRSGWI